MIASPLSGDGVRVWVTVQPVDTRKSFDGLAEVVRTFLGNDPLSDSLFVFRNRSSQRLKILWYDRDGLAIHYKRLSRGAFRFPSGEDKVMAIDSAQLLRLLSGMTVAATKDA